MTVGLIKHICKIFTDDIEEVANPILDFNRYCDTIVKMVRGSKKFSIGIYGEWGTGKTTLMKMIQNRLNEFVQREEFVWEDIISDNTEQDRLTSFLK